jgi:hypothetical protein
MIAEFLSKITATEHDSSSQSGASSVDVSRIRFRQADSWEETEAAFRLLHDTYLHKGLIKANGARLRYTHFNLLPDTATFIASLEGEVVATLSVIPECDPFGLPMGQLYAHEMGTLKASGRRLAEGSGLAIDSRFTPISLYLGLSLIKMVITYSKKLGYTDNVIVCHPKHARFYKRALLFEQIGGVRTYQAVNDAPAVALRLDLINLKETYRAASGRDGDGIYRFFFSDEIFRCPEAALRAGAFSREIKSKLCELQPAVARTLDRVSPGTVRRLTGQTSADFRRRGDGQNCMVWEAPPGFLAA